MVAVIKKAIIREKLLAQLTSYKLRTSILFFISEKYELQEQSLELETFKNQT
jgi:hypothetical protein